jgi:hypothetical protein
MSKAIIATERSLLRDKMPDKIVFYTMAKKKSRCITLGVRGESIYGI